MKLRLIGVFQYYLFWIVYFFTVRGVFLIYNNGKIESVREVLKSFYYGIFMDLSITSYFMVIVGIIFSFSVFISGKMLYYCLKYLSIFLIIVVNLIVITDLELYKNWGFRIDNTVFTYLKNPQEALASSDFFLILSLILLLLLGIFFSYYSINKIVIKLKNIEKVKWYYSILFLLFSIFMIIPIRGGVNLAPMNVGYVYYSKNQFCNHSAINAIWNFFKTIVDNNNKKENIVFFGEYEVDEIFNKLKEKKTDNEIIKLLNLEKPNVIILILESFSYNCLEVLGGRKGITPNYDKLSEEGILFENCIANGNRTDRGIVSILSGYPTQAKNSILKNVKKVEKLPNLALEFKKMGYSRRFYYGGDINFVNMKSYFLMGGVDSLITDKYFSNENQNRWGAFDEYVFEKLHKDIASQRRPFFNIVLTITSHEPFSTPKGFKRILKDENDENKYLNAINYTDKCIGDFIEKAKKESWYDSTLIVLVSDHGNKHPGDKDYNSLECFRIPMLWIGGALKPKKMRIKEYLNQSDLALTLGNQLSQKWEKVFPFSKDIFTNKENFANYSFNNGIGFFNKEDGFIWDINTNKFILEPKNKETQEKGKAFFQILMKDYEAK